MKPGTEASILPSCSRMAPSAFSSIRTCARVPAVTRSLLTAAITAVTFVKIQGRLVTGTGTSGVPTALYSMQSTLAMNATENEKIKHYEIVEDRIGLLIKGESDLVAVLATIACELHHSFDYYHWTGFYQLCTRGRSSLVIGPYQGSHGCLRIPIGKGVCGIAAQTRATQLVPNVHEFPGHIACASTTESEVVVPYFSAGGELLGVLDVDSDNPAAFTAADVAGLESICKHLRAWNVFHENLEART